MNKTIIASAVVGVLALSGVISEANANLLTIDHPTGVAEAIGDPGGTNHAFGPTPVASGGPGMPTALGGWPPGPGFALDTGLPPGGIWESRAGTVHTST